MNIVDLVEKNARLYPDETAYVEIRPLSNRRKAVTWREFHARTNRLANALLRRGVRKETGVFLLGKNSLNWMECYFGVLKTGAIIIPLNFRFTDRDISHCADVAGPTAFIFDPEYGARIESLKASLKTVENYICMGETDLPGIENFEMVIGQASPAAQRAQLDDQHTCALYFTSGTTGAPKPVMLNHDNLFCTALTEGHNNAIRHEDSLLMMPPLYHLAIGHLLGVLTEGGKTVLLTERITPRFILETMQNEGISYLFLLVPWALDLLEALDSNKIVKEDYGLDAWRLTQMGAQPVPASVVRRLKTYFPNMRFDTTYGLSESAGPGVVHLGIENEHKVGALGKASISWSARIVDIDGNDVKAGEVGELIVKGNGVMRGYFKNPELTEATLKNGWLYTGDLAKQDEDGFIFLVDRKKDLVISGGENIYPAEVEQVLLHHPKIYDAAVIGTPHERLGEIVTAVIQPIPDATLTQTDIVAFCEEHLPRYRRPRAVIFGMVPRSPTGKIEKNKLRKKYC